MWLNVHTLEREPVQGKSLNWLPRERERNYVRKHYACAEGWVAAIRVHACMHACMHVYVYVRKHYACAEGWVAAICVHACMYVHEPMHSIMYIAILYARSNVYVETYACYNRCNVYVHALMYMSKPMHAINNVMKSLNSIVCFNI